MKQIIKNSKEFEIWCKENWSNPISIDFETTSLDYLEMDLVGFSLYNGTNSCYVPENVILPMVDNQSFICHSSVFDMKCLQKFFGIKNGYKPICTLTGAKLVNGNLYSYSLKNLARDWLKVSSDKIKTWTEAKKYGYNSKEFYDYAQNDSIWCWDLWELEEKEIKKQNLEYLFYEIEMPFTFVLRDLEINGVLVDRDKLNKLREKVVAKKIELESDMLKIFGLKHYLQTNFLEGMEYVSPINFNSSPQLVRIIEDRLHFPIDVFTKKGNPSIGIEYLLKHKEEHKFFSLLYDYKKVSKMLSGFIDSLPDYLSLDGRVRPSYNLVRSGRLSCSDPNLQQLPNPKKEKLIVNYREIFVPKKGNVFVRADFSGEELRVLAEVSKDKRMIDAFNNNYDLHLLTANTVFELSLSDEELIKGSQGHQEAIRKYSSQRHKAKNGVNFPIVYGTSEYGISKRLGVPVKESKRWIKEFFKLYPGIKEAVNNTVKELEQQEWVATMMGRRRRFPGYNKCNWQEKSKIRRQAFNHKIQGASADIGKIAGVKLLRYLPEYNAKVVLFVHDEYVFECPKNVAEAFAKKVKEVMENSVCLSVKMLVDVSIVENYGK